VPGRADPAVRPAAAWSLARNRLVSLRVDLRSPQIPAGDIELDLDLDHSTIKLLVAEDAVIDQWDLAWAGRGKVKQTYHHKPAGAGRRIRLTSRG
jgi:hypothetical protein